jgi:hypothetical protein
MKPQPWPLPPPRVVSTEPPASAAPHTPLDAHGSEDDASSCDKPGNTQDLQEAEQNVGFLPFSKQNSSHPCSLIHHALTRPSLQVHPSVANATDAPRNPSSETLAPSSPSTADTVEFESLTAAAAAEIAAAAAALSPHPRGPVTRLPPPNHSLSATAAAADDTPDHVRSFSPGNATQPEARPTLIHTSRDSGSSGDERACDAKSAFEDVADDFVPVAIHSSSEQFRAKTSLQFNARLAFASGLLRYLLRVQLKIIFSKVQRLPLNHCERSSN